MALCRTLMGSDTKRVSFLWFLFVLLRVPTSFGICFRAIRSEWESRHRHIVRQVSFVLEFTNAIWTIMLKPHLILGNELFGWTVVDDHVTECHMSKVRYKYITRKNSCHKTVATSEKYLRCLHTGLRLIDWSASKNFVHQSLSNCLSRLPSWLTLT